MRKVFPELNRIFVILLVLFSVVGSQASIAQTATKLQPELETRARALFLQLRCVVCQNQSIGDSDADVAKDLRQIVREQIAAGQSDQQIKLFLVARYGEFILLRPVFAWHTLVLWGAPFVLLFAAGLLAWRMLRSKSESKSEQQLSVSEQAELDQILEKERF